MALSLKIYTNHLGETTICSTNSPCLYLSQIATELAKKKKKQNRLFSGALKLERFKSRTQHQHEGKKEGFVEGHWGVVREHLRQGGG